MRVEAYHLVPLMTTKLTWPTMRLTRRPTTGNAKPWTGVDDTGYGDNAMLEMKLKRGCHRNRFCVRTNKAIKSGKAVGISAPADIDENHNAIYGNNDAGYSEEAGHKDRAYQGQ
jgi:hypothetical protein